LIKKITYKDQVVDFIYKEILRGNLLPKQQVKESHLSEILGISRAPIREALKELINIGIVEYKPRIGTFVIDLTPKDILNTYETRGVLEGYAAACSKDRFSAKDLDKLYAMCDKMEILAKARKNIELIDLGDEFHEMVFVSYDNVQLVKFTKTLSIKSHLMFSKYWPKLYKPSEIKSRHKVIVDAIQSKNAQKIESCLREHYIETGQKIAKLKEKGE
jgi:DNA-binding GntR family transcriptional regulator